MTRRSNARHLTVATGCVAGVAPVHPNGFARHLAVATGCVAGVES
jgi:hypothetical protein